MTKEQEIEVLEQDIANLTDRLDEISTQVPMCAKCSRTGLEERAYMYECYDCGHLTPKIAIKYKRIPK